jgi:hypothetical protein
MSGDLITTSQRKNYKKNITCMTMDFVTTLNWQILGILQRAWLQIEMYIISVCVYWEVTADVL